eukprot:TRINITY_DN2344_c0_g1_i2.p1 TRINITY_DN2344_c0_g1~~TRINITY_DN2344_c0_g1_i2.p1  ORF type:complete len:930 (+),score=260.77 TRINITY_DN2344_c0_g1_i2:170-2959(+)
MATFGDDDGQAADIKDISNSAAFIHLQELFGEGKVTEAEMVHFKSKFSQIHEVVLATYENEKLLLKKAKALNQELVQQKARIEKASATSYENNTEVTSLRREMLKAENEVALCQEREAMMQLEITELQRQRTDLAKDVEKIQKMNAELLEPQINQLKKTIEELKTEIEHQTQILERLQKDEIDSTQRLSQLRSRKQELDLESTQLRATLANLKSNPEKFKKQADVVQTAIHSLESEANRLTNELYQLDVEINNQNRRRKDAEEEGIDYALQQERHRQALEQKDRQASQVLKELELAKDEAGNNLTDRMKLEVDQKMQEIEFRRENDMLLRQTRRKDGALRSVRRLEFNLSHAQAALPGMKIQLEDARHQLESMKYQSKKQKDELEELKREVDIHINTFLNQENLEKEQSDSLRRITATIGALESEIATYQLQELTLNREIADLAALRELKAREAAKAVEKFKEVKEELKVKDLVREELTKKNQELAVRLKEFSALYEIVKNERNKYVNMIQASAQAVAEMKEKIKIVQNEIEILRNESMAKDKSLSKERLAHQTAFKSRDNQRNELNKKLYHYRVTQETLEQQIAEIDKLNSIINGMEEEMVRMRKMYEIAVEDRNYTGIQLIDRNDELCILYEKLNIQESISKNGNIEMRKREQEIRMLNLLVANLEREVAVTRKLLPQIAQYESEIVTMQNHLLFERKRVDKLSKELESPTNTKRWRPLEGKDPDPEELQAKLQSLEERLNEKQEQLLEKELVMEEITNLSDRLRKQASEGKSDTLELAKKVNDFQSRIKDITRRMMATVAELSMYQASSIKLEQERKEKELSLEEAKWLVDQGQPPTADAERTWYRMERDRLRRKEQAIMVQAQTENAAALAYGAIETTAEPRPNAYVVDELGLPRPYGGLAPFKPSDPGSSMRHIRKPVAKPIEI